MTTSQDVFNGLVQNLTLLLALAFLYGFICQGLSRQGLSRPVLSGVLFGVISVGSMLQSVELESGIIIDARTVMLSLAAPFGGVLAVLIAAAIVSAYRIWLGVVAFQEGALFAVEGTAAGLTSIALTTLISYGALRYRRRLGRDFRLWELYVLGLVATFPPLVVAFWFPIPWQLLERTTVPLLTIVPIATAFLGALLSAQSRLFRDQAALKASEARYRLLADNAADIISLHQPDGRWRYASPALETVLGFPPGHAVGKRPQIYLDPRDADAFTGLFAPDGPETATVAARWLHRDGQPVWCETTARRLRDPATGRVQQIAAATRDISQRKRYELDLEESRRRLAQQAAELQRINDDLRASKEAADAANRAKSRFLAAASHDLRQPFQGMRIFHHLLESDPPPAERRQAVRRLGEALSGGEELLNALLDVSILDAGRVTPNLGPVPVHRILQAELAHLLPAAREKGLRLRPGPMQAWVMTDQVLLRRMLRNLIANAIRYTDRGGVLVGCRRRGAQVLIEIWDTGIGIAPEHAKAVFEDFYQIGNAERDRRRGLGLGLSIVLRTARLLGHEVTLRSRPGKGSCFTIVLPAAVGEEAMAGAPARAEVQVPGPARPAADGIRAPAAAADAGPRRVLVVEDDAIQRIGLVGLIQGWGCEVVSAGGSDAALDLARGHPPDLIVSDFRLPGPVTGAQLILRIRAEAGRDIPAIIVTGDTDPARLREAAVAGCHLLHKPYVVSALRKTIAAALDPAGRPPGAHAPRIVGSGR